MINEYIKLFDFDYDECCLYLLEKYGNAADDYFTNASYERFKKGEIKSPTKKKISRTKEGLYLHHIDEDKQILISTPSAIIKYDIPFEYQTKERLVYCNLIEHGILHILIAKKDVDNGTLGQDGQLHGIGGYTNFIRPQLIQWLVKETIPTLAWQINCRNTVLMPKDSALELITFMDKYLINNYPISLHKIELATDNWMLSN